MGIVISCHLLHLIGAGISPSPWWVPNATLIGLVIAVTAKPRRWLENSLLAGLLMTVWAIRTGWLFLPEYLLIGWIVRLTTIEWDVMDLRVQGSLLSAMACVLTLLHIWFENQWSSASVGLGLLHVASTLICLPLLRRLVTGS